MRRRCPSISLIWASFMRRIALSRSLASLGSALLFPVAFVAEDLSVINVRLDRLEIDDMLSSCENYDDDMFINYWPPPGVIAPFKLLPGS